MTEQKQDEKKPEPVCDRDWFAKRGHAVDGKWDRPLMNKHRKPIKDYSGESYSHQQDMH